MRMMCESERKAPMDRVCLSGVFVCVWEWICRRTFSICLLSFEFNKSMKSITIKTHTDSTNEWKLCTTRTFPIVELIFVFNFCSVLLYLKILSIRLWWCKCSKESRPKSTEIQCICVFDVHCCTVCSAIGLATCCLCDRYCLCPSFRIRIAHVSFTITNDFMIYISFSVQCRPQEQIARNMKKNERQSSHIHRRTNNAAFCHICDAFNMLTENKKWISFLGTNKTTSPSSILICRLSCNGIQLVQCSGRAHITVHIFVVHILS